QVAARQARKKADGEGTVSAKTAAVPEPQRTPGDCLPGEPTASMLIDGRIADLGDWRGTTLARVRELIKQVDPEIVEEWKWRGTPVWSHNGGVCTGETYKSVVKLTFFKGAALADPA